MATLAALQVDPRNAHQLERLEAASTLVIERAQGGLCLSPVDAARLTSQGALAHQYAPREDPAENVFCEEILTPWGGVLVGGGLSGQSVFVLRALLKALFAYRPIDAEVTRIWLQLFTTALSASDAVFFRAGIKRGSRYQGAPGSRVSADEDSDRLVHAVVIDVDNEEARVGLQTALAPLIQDHGAVKPIARADRPSRPFVISGDQLLVAYPLEIASALRHQVASTIVERGLQDEFHVRWALATADVLSTAMLRLGMEPLAHESLNLPPPTSQHLPLVESIYRFDDNKLAHVLLIADDLSGYEPSQLFQQWPLEQTAQLSPPIIERLTNVREALLERADTEHVHSLVLLAPLDRGISLALPDVGWPMFVLPLFDLEAFAYAEAGDPLALWKFGHARAETRRRAEIHEFSPLDLYVLYRDLSRSLVFPVPVDVVVAKPGGGGELRADAARRFDPHPVPHPTGIAIGVERSLPHAPEVPIYFPRSSPAAAFECLIEGDDAFLWVTGPDSDAGRSIGFAIAYWLWQVFADIAPELRTMADSNDVIAVEFDFAAPERWEYSTDLTTVERRAVGGLFAERYASESGHRGLRLLESARLAFHSADNAGERELLSNLLALVFDIAEERVAEIVERRAPLGYKKQLLFGRGPDPRLSPRGLPEHRPVQPYDQREANRVVSTRLAEAMLLQVGEVPASQRQDVLHGYVTSAFAELVERAARLSPVGLLERLVLFNERVVHEQAHARTSALTNLLAYGDVDESIAQRDEALMRLNRAAVTTRFLIEYVAATPPQGRETFSVAAFDELLAVASEILDAGGLSDSLLVGLTDPDVVVTPTGLVVFANPESAVESRDRFFSEFLEGETATARAVLEQLVWDPVDEPIVLPQELDDALLDEVGLSLNEIGLFFNTLLDRGIEEESGLAVLGFTEVASLLEGAGGWDEARTTHALGTFSLQERSGFDCPPRPHSRGDIYPWKMNRSLSYVRRPLLRRGEDVIFGVRHTYNAQMHLAGLIEVGRFPARKSKLKKFQGRLGARVGKDFEDAVATLYRGHDGMWAATRVKQFGSHRIVDPDGASLGDIDVLVVDRHRERLLLIDTKAVSAALNAGEVVAQAQRLFTGSHSTVAKQLARADWVRKNIVLVSGALGLSPASTWEVTPLIVTDRVLPAAHVGATAVRVLSYGLLRSELERAARGMSGTSSDA